MNCRYHLVLLISFYSFFAQASLPSSSDSVPQPQQKQQQQQQQGQGLQQEQKSPKSKFSSSPRRYVHASPGQEQEILEKAKSEVKKKYLVSGKLGAYLTSAPDFFMVVVTEKLKNSAEEGRCGNQYTVVVEGDEGHKVRKVEAHGKKCMKF